MCKLGSRLFRGRAENVHYMDRKWACHCSETMILLRSHVKMYHLGFRKLAFGGAGDEKVAWGTGSYTSRFSHCSCGTNCCIATAAFQDERCRCGWHAAVRIDVRNACSHPTDNVLGQDATLAQIDVSFPLWTGVCLQKEILKHVASSRNSQGGALWTNVRHCRLLGFLFWARR